MRDQTSQPDGAHGPGEWRRNWKMMIPSVAGIMLSTVHGYSLGVMMGPLEKEFGWTRAEISTGPFIMAMTALFVAPLMGIAVDRYGPRRIGVAGVLLFCAALGLLSQANANIASWCGLWFVLGVMGAGVLTIIWTAAINSVFDKNRGLALAVALCGTGLGAAIVPRLTFQLSEAYGWRGGYIALALIAVVTVFPLVFFLFHSAADAHGENAKSPAVKPLTGVSARKAILSAGFLKLAGASFIISIAFCSLIINAVPILVSKGMERGDAASIAGLVGLGAIVGRLTGGYLLDRLKANQVAAVAVLFPTITATILLFAPHTAQSASAAYFVLGLATGTELDAVAYLAARHFGLKSFGTLFGLMNGMMIFANGISPMLANFMYDATKTYDFVLWMQYPMCLATSLLFLLLGPYKTFETEAAADNAAKPAAAE